MPSEIEHGNRKICFTISHRLLRQCHPTKAKPYQLLFDFVRKSPLTSFQLLDAEVEDDTLLSTLLRRRRSERSEGSTSFTTASALVPVGGPLQSRFASQGWRPSTLAGGRTR